MTTSIIPALQSYYKVNQQNQENRSSYCSLLWRRGQLLVKPVGQMKQPYIPSLEKEQKLVECLKRSPANLVRIDPKVGEAKIRMWALACEQASKPIFLRIPTADKHSKQASPLLSLLKSLIDWIIAFLLLILAIMPIFGWFLLLRMSSPGDLFTREWRVGKRGKLFQVFKLRTTIANQQVPAGELIASQNSVYGIKEAKYLPFAKVLLKYGLDNLPQLLNVLRFEMGLIGPHCFSLHDAVNLSAQRQQQLNALPGIMSLWQEEPNFNPASPRFGKTV